MRRFLQCLCDGESVGPKFFSIHFSCHFLFFLRAIPRIFSMESAHNITMPINRALVNRTAPIAIITMDAVRGCGSTMWIHTKMKSATVSRKNTLSRMQIAVEKCIGYPLKKQQATIGLLPNEASAVKVCFHYRAQCQ